MTGCVVCALKIFIQLQRWNKLSRRVGALILIWSPSMKYLLPVIQPTSYVAEPGRDHKVKFLAARNCRTCAPVKVHLYSTMLKSLLVYGILTWIAAADNHLKALLPCKRNYSDSLQGHSDASAIGCCLTKLEGFTSSRWPVRSGIVREFLHILRQSGWWSSIWNARHRRDAGMLGILLPDRPVWGSYAGRMPK